MNCWMNERFYVHPSGTSSVSWSMPLPFLNNHVLTLGWKSGLRRTDLWGLLVLVGPGAQPGCLTFIMWTNGPEWNITSVRSPPHLLASIASAHVHPVSTQCQVLNSHTCLKPGISGILCVLWACCPPNLFLFFWINKNILFQELSWSLGPFGQIGDFLWIS